MSRSRALFVAGGVLVALVLGLAPPAGAVVVPIDGLVLNGPGPTAWDPYTNPLPGCTTLLPAGVYTPVDDGSYGADTDGFDGGLLMSINGTFFTDPDGNGNKSGEQLKVGPATIKGLQVTRTERALATSPTLRDLVKLNNTSNKTRSRTILLGSDLGTDSATDIGGTSSGDLDLGTNDRWVVTTDAGIDDPPVSHVFFGKHAGTKVDAVIQEPGSLPEEGCVVVSFHVRIPAESTVYLLFFAELHEQSAAGLAAALFADAVKFNKASLNASLLTGLSSKVKSKVVNWDLA